MVAAIGCMHGHRPMVIAALKIRHIGFLIRLQRLSIFFAILRTRPRSMGLLAPRELPRSRIPKWGSETG